ncbi:class I SAM-dependent methyltransferase [Egicoccus sp. AB-alg2]|uniref:class I SAM-dependent methyltransferase n=1 Tax=Egicoccus sp. AB-alg2 TaxID=3242693 RepID=UPI00359F01F8
MTAPDRRALTRSLAVSAGAAVVGAGLVGALGRDPAQAALGGLLGGNLALAVETRLRLAALGRGQHRTRAELRGALQATAERIDASLAAALPQPATAPEASEPPASRADLEAARKQARKDTDVARRQTEAATQLALLLRPSLPIPATGGWALSADAAALVVGLVLATRPARIVECGSGTSSLWLGYALRRAGTGTMVALDHDERFAAQTREHVRRHGLDDVVEVRHAPLVEQAFGPHTQPWYDPSAWADLTDVDLLLVDGPPRRVAPMARVPALYAFHDRLRGGATVILDDAKRPEERRAVEDWERLTGLTAERRDDLEKGAALLRVPNRPPTA